MNKEKDLNGTDVTGGGNVAGGQSNEEQDKSLLYVATFIVALVLLACVLAFL